MNFSIIVPIFNESESIIKLNSEIIETVNLIKPKGHLFELIYVDDGSTDNSFKILNNLKNPISTTILKNYKNLSQSTSILNGVECSAYDNIILLDGDLQNDPNDLIKMIEKYEKKENVVIHGYRKFRQDPFFSKKLPSRIANFLVRFFSGSSISDHGCSLKIFNKTSIDVHNFFGDFHRLFAAQIVNKEINIIEMEVNHRPRLKGQSNYGFERIFRVLIDLIFLNFVKNEKSYFYSIGFLGLFSFFLSILCLIYMVYLKLFMGQSFILTPLPILFFFFSITGLIFFSIILTLETIKKMIKNKNEIKKNYKMVKKDFIS